MRENKNFDKEIHGGKLKFKGARKDLKQTRKEIQRMTPVQHARQVLHTVSCGSLLTYLQAPNFPDKSSPYELHRKSICPPRFGISYESAIPLVAHYFRRPSRSGFASMDGSSSLSTSCGSFGSSDFWRYSAPLGSRAFCFFILRS